MWAARLINFRTTVLLILWILEKCMIWRICRYPKEVKRPLCSLFKINLRSLVIWCNDKVISTQFLGPSNQDISSYKNTGMDLLDWDLLSGRPKGNGVETESRYCSCPALTLFFSSYPASMLIGAETNQPPKLSKAWIVLWITVIMGKFHFNWVDIFTW